MENENLYLSKEEWLLIRNIINLVINRILKHKIFSDEITKRSLIHLIVKIDNFLGMDC